MKDEICKWVEMKTKVRRKLNKTERLLFVVPLVALFAPAVSYFRGDGLDRKLRAMAGPYAVDCGVLNGDEENEFEAKAETMDFCADAAHNQGKPLYMRQNVLLDGVRGSLGYVRTPEGKLYSIYYNAPRWIPFYIKGDLRPFKPSEPTKHHSGKVNLRKTRYWLLY